MFDFSKIFNWKLKSGSHDFPGPDGGTCINEAAIVAAGFEYKKISSAHDCPPCFSRPIASYAIRLNDRMPDDLRQKLLMPFVTRLAGTADTKEVEKKRIDFIVIETTKRILSLVCEERLKNKELAEKCRQVKSIKEVRLVANEIRKSDAYAAAAYAAAYADSYDSYADAYAYAAYAADAAAYADSYDAYAAAATAAAYAAADAAADAADAATAAKEKYFTIACQILDETILLGKHQEIEIESAVKLLEKARKPKVAA